ncbi:hypothetical protein [Haladaptatus sp. CMAA 1911]|uniref:hypothetical protein n=1 Tax=unclassified Haladaptatus TaxID=2622732 RepID=UPI0037551427
MQEETATWLGGIGALFIGILCAVATGPPGILAGVIFLLVWYTVPTLYSVAFGQLVVAVFADSITAEYLILLEVGLLAVLVGPLLTVDRPRWRVTVTSAMAVLFGVGALKSLQWSNQLWVAIAVVVFVFAIVSYGLHRYERVALGLVEESTHE